MKKIFNAFNAFMGMGIEIGHEAVLAHDFKTLQVRGSNSPYYTHKLFAVAQSGEYRELTWNHAIDFKAMSICQCLINSTDKDFVEIRLQFPYGIEVPVMRISNERKKVEVFISQLTWDTAPALTGDYSGVPCLIGNVEHMLYFKPTFKQWDDAE